MEMLGYGVLGFLCGWGLTDLIRTFIRIGRR